MLGAGSRGPRMLVLSTPPDAVAESRSYPPHTAQIKEAWMMVTSSCGG